MPVSPTTIPRRRGSSTTSTSYHSAYYIDHDRPPPPLLLASGFTDDLFPVDEVLRYANRTRKLHPRTPMSLLLGDFGHQRAANKAVERKRLHRRHPSLVQPLPPRRLQGAPPWHDRIRADVPQGEGIAGPLPCAHVRAAVEATGPLHLPQAALDSRLRRRRPRNRTGAGPRGRQRRRLCRHALWSGPPALPTTGCAPSNAGPDQPARSAEADRHS